MGLTTGIIESMNETLAFNVLRIAVSHDDALLDCPGAFGVFAGL